MKEFELIIHYDRIGDSDMFNSHGVGQLVRCKDCKHHEDEEVGMVYCPNIVGGWVREDFYCGDGERKDEAEE